MNRNSTYLLHDIAGIINGQLSGSPNHLFIEHLVTDSRKVLFPSSSLFFALDGPRRSGTAFITELYTRDVRAFVINDKNFQTNNFPEASFITVDNVLNALQLLAIHHRNSFNLPVIGITGSNGKTIVKEWLFQLLQTDYNIVRSPKSYNSQVGVPLSVWEINETHTLGIFEAGISLPGEMERLQKMIQPAIGIFTNIGDAHNEGFESMQQKVTEKIKLFKDAEGILYCRDYEHVDQEIQKITAEDNPKARIFSWSRKSAATLCVTGTDKQLSHTVIHFDYAGNSHHLTVPFTDEASLENLITCICVLLSLNYEFVEIEKRIRLLLPVEMRLQLRQGINNCSVIDDTYSADLSSMAIALDFLSQQKQHKKHTVIVSDILQSGKTEIELYSLLAAMLKEKNVDRIIGVGPVIERNKNAFEALSEKTFYPSSVSLKQNFASLNFSNETILLKGARVFEFEDISNLLQQKTHRTVLEIDLTAMAHNLQQYQALLHPGVKLMVMVKASGYGSGSFEIASMLQYHKVDYLAVAYADEGVELRKAGISLPIMVMNPEESTFEVLTRFDLEPELFSFGILSGFAGFLKRAAIPQYPVHLKLDTGMHRLGFEPSEINQLGQHILDYPELKIQSVFSHLAASDDLNEADFTFKQGKVFTGCCHELKKITGYSFLRHIANSSGISQHPQLHLDMVRLGIGIYGVDANPQMQANLKNVTTLKTTVAQLKQVNAGDAVGYGRKATVLRDSLIATVRIGYADGYPRSLGNGNGRMIIAGKLVPVIGNVCMDMTMLDVTGVSEISEGDQVLVFGEGLPVSDLARSAGTIAYEIMTGVSERVKRVYFE